MVAEGGKCAKVERESNGVLGIIVMDAIIITATSAFLKAAASTEVP